MERVRCFLNKLHSNIDKHLKIKSIKKRPNANHGLWVGFLLPACLIACICNSTVSHVFKLTCACSWGLTLATFLFIIFTSITDKNLTTWNDILAPGLSTTILCSTLLNRGIIFSLTSGFSTSIGFKYGLLLILNHCPLSFTLGEAFLITQAVVLFLYSSIVHLSSSIYETPISNHEIITNILEVGLLTVLLVVITLFNMRLKMNITKFFVVVFMYISLMLATLHFTLRQSPILWIITYIFTDLKKILMIVYWAAASGLGTIAIATQTSIGSKASTARRKIFHILSVAVYLPGFIFECDLIYLASGIAFAGQIALETVRKLNLGWFSEMLDDGFYVFSDEKDVGGISLTPMYLLIGIATPLFIHPAPCDPSATGLLILLSGILSVGIGDTAASYFGSKYGKRKWPGSSKSLEGTFASIASQILLITCLSKLGFISFNTMTMFISLIAVLVNAMVEALTDQVDNLTLPLITFFILIFG
ncbi:dolichol kinase [Arctopsyche grandis]|uniref:dolichol kinase n=1 Tax=Arctopsyche grandis TaxID=121162 RepID=UPI00406D8DA3